MWVAKAIGRALLMLTIFAPAVIGEEKQDMYESIRFATFNVSMEADNYEDANRSKGANSLINALRTGQHPQIKNIAEIIQRVRPDVILLNEFDYIEDTQAGIEQFKSKYLSVSQQGQAAIDYPFVYIAPVNTGVPTDLPKQTQNEQLRRLTHYGFGKYPGQYGMVLLSKFPIIDEGTRTFQTFLWKDMPNNVMPINPDGTSWYHKDEVDIMRLSSKSHWDIPLRINGQVLHVLASHPTPPVFDGKEDRNGRRNHDELRFWKDYIQADQNTYHYDDSGKKGGLLINPVVQRQISGLESSEVAEANLAPKFVILGDLNASDVEGDAYPGAAAQLLKHPLINQYPAPTSQGGIENNQQAKRKSDYAATHTAGWGMRADYVLPSANLTVVDSGVFWPASNKPSARLVKDRKVSSDHRLVWVDIKKK